MRGLRLLAIQAAILVAITVLFELFDLDRRTAGLFYDAQKGWHLTDGWLWTGLYQYGTIPGVVLAVGCLIGWLTTFFFKKMESWRPYFLITVLTVALSAGFLVNAVLKQYYGRPRPDQITEFGGQWQYRHVFPPGTPGKGASFPSGHSAMGFVFVSLLFWYRKSKFLAVSGTATGLVLGGLLSLGRIIQGSHFPTDNIWSLGIVLMTATALYYGGLGIPAFKVGGALSAMGRSKKVLLAAVFLVAAVAITASFMTRRPFYETHLVRAKWPQNAQTLTIALNAEPERLKLLYGPEKKMTIRIHAHGFGWAYFNYRLSGRVSQRQNGVRADIHIDARSYFAELDHALDVILPESARGKVKVKIEQVKDNS